MTENSLLRFGFVAACEEYSPTELVKFGVMSEEHRLDAVWASDHFHPWWHTDGHGVFAWNILSAIGALTRKVILGTSVTCPLFRYSPAIVAQSFATLSCLYPGRIFLGVGTGEALNEVPCGFDWPSSHRERLERLKEALIIIRLLWSRDFVTFKGKFYRVTKANIYDKPPIQIPIHVATTGVKGAELAGALGDALMSLPLEDTSMFTSKIFPALEKAARKYDRAPEMIEKSLLVHVGFHKDNYDAALRSLLKWRPTLLPAFFDLGVYDPRYIEMHGDRVSTEAIKKYFLVADSEEKIISFMEKYIKTGFTHIAAAVSGDVEGFIKILGNTISPYLKETYGGKFGDWQPYRGCYPKEALEKIIGEMM